MNQNNYSSWKSAWSNSLFRRITIIILLLLVLVAVFSPSFFDFIESRKGTRLNDPIINFLPDYDMSLPVFMIFWLMFLVAIVRSIRSPQFFLVFIIGYLLIVISRFITITLIPLEPPNGLIELKDPLINLLYGNHFISKDLFFSGHTATLLVISFCLEKKHERIAGFTASFTVAILLLFQNVHFTIDVVAAFFFAWMMTLLAKKIISGELNQKIQKLHLVENKIRDYNLPDNIN